MTTKSEPSRHRKPLRSTSDPLPGPPSPPARAIFGPFDPRDDRRVEPGDLRILDADLRSDLEQIDIAATLLDDRAIARALTLAFGPARDSSCVTALLARRSGVDLLRSLPGTEMIPGPPSRSEPTPPARIRFRGDRECETRAAIERAWSSLVLMAWEVDAVAAARAGLPSAIDPTLPEANEGDGEGETLVVRQRVATGDLTYARASEAIELDRIYAALRHSKTWSGFRAAMPPDEYELLIKQSFDEEGLRRPRPKIAFDPSQIAGYCDGDYPKWLQASMDRYLPKDVIRDFGRSAGTRFNGDYLELASCDRLAINRRLRRHGYRVLDGSHLFFM